MSSRPPDLVERPNHPESVAGGSATRNDHASPAHVADYLRARAGELSQAWSTEIRGRGLGQGTRIDAVVERFVTQLTGLLPWLFGPNAVHVQPLWDRTAELFGVMAAKRGLAAGEVIEEFQVLRELLIRALAREPVPEGSLSLRDTLRLHRIVDCGVTYASVGHTDAMFFEFLERPEGEATLSPEEIAHEAELQLEAIREELSQIVEITPLDGAGTDVQN